MYRIRFLLIVSLFLVFPSIRAQAQSRDKQFLEIMSYNVENLFDTVHDEGKIDWTFLPSHHPEKEEGCSHVSGSFYRRQCYEVHWNETKLNIKLGQIHDIIYRERKRVPDLLGLIEVENANVVSMLAKKLGYTRFQVTDSPDQRGIDVALLYKENPRLKYVSHQEYNLKELKVLRKNTRNILEVTFKVDNRYLLSVFVNHWPSQAGPTFERVTIAKFLAKIVKQKLTKSPSHRIVLLGDFNTLESERPHPLRTTLLTQQNPLLADLHQQYHSVLPAEERRPLPKGSHYYEVEKSWSLLDKILVTNNMLPSSRDNGLEVDLKSFEIYAPKFATSLYDELLEEDGLAEYVAEMIEDHKNTFGIPRRYNFNTEDKSKAGYSDHLPLVVRLQY